MARCGIGAIRGGDAPGGAALLPVGPGGRVLIVARHLPPHTPQWNGVVALAAARTFVPAGMAGEAAEELTEIGAAELLLPARAFRPIAAATDLTMDGVRDLALRFAAPIRLTLRQWLQTGTWTGLALLWRDEAGVLRLGWRAASPGVRFPPAAALGRPADALWSGMARLRATMRTGRPHHGVEEIRTGSGPQWWFTRFGIVRNERPERGGPAGERAVLALVTLAPRPGSAPQTGAPKDIPVRPASRAPWHAATPRRAPRLGRSRRGPASAQRTTSAPARHTT